MPITVTLQPGYIQKDLFFAALKVQLEIFNESQDPRCFESPQIIEKNNTLCLTSSAKNSTLVTHFYDQMKKAQLYTPWEKARAQSPFQLNDTGKREAKLATFDKYQLANFLAAITVQFKEDMSVFLSQEEIKQQMAELKISEGQLLLASANVLQAVFAPLGEMAHDEETQIIYGFCTSAITKFCLKDNMVPPPGDTLESACDAMLHQISLTLTQPIGEEKAYGGMLGKDTPTDKMKGMLLGTELAFDLNNIAIPPGAYQIPDACFSIQENWSETKIFYHFLHSNQAFLRQLDNHWTNPALCQIAFKRLYQAIQQDSRYPSWLKEKTKFIELINSISEHDTWILLQEKQIITEIQRLNKKPDELIDFFYALLLIKPNYNSPPSEDENGLITALILADIVDRSTNFTEKQVLLLLLNSQLPLYSKLHFSAAIAENMQQGLFFKNNLALGLSSFIDASPENIYSKVERFLFNANPEGIKFKKAPHALVYYCMRANQEHTEFKKGFVLLIPFLIRTGIACDLKCFFSKSSPDESEIRGCLEYLDDLDLSENQKNNFRKFLKELNCNQSYRDRIGSEITFDGNNKHVIWQLPASPTTVTGTLSPLTLPKK